jgi:hypothetical protein
VREAVETAGADLRITGLKAGVNESARQKTLVSDLPSYRIAGRAMFNRKSPIGDRQSKIN